MTGVDDVTVDGTQQTDILFEVNIPQSNTGFANATPRSALVETLDDDQAGFTITETENSTTVNESGTTDILTVVLDRRPLSDVVLGVSGNNPGEAQSNVDTLTFTPDNWDDAQTVTISGQDDLIADGNAVTVFTISVDDDASNDAFDNVGNQVVAVTTVDNDLAGIALAISGGNTEVSEDETSDTVGVVLTAMPQSPVVLEVFSTDEGEAVVNVDQLTFTPNNWDQARTLTITGVDDEAVDGTETTPVVFSVIDALSDNAYDNVADVSFTVTTLDNDQAGLRVVQTNNSTVVSESGQTDTLGVALSSQPESDVVIDITSSDDDEIELDIERLMFTPQNWDALQFVTLTGQDDDLVDGNQQIDITLEVVDELSNNAFDNLSRLIVAVNEDNDQAGFTISETNNVTAVNESGTSDIFTVVLDRRPLTDVVLSVVSGDTGEATVSTDQLTFTTQNWDQPQQIQVTGVDDVTVDGTQQTAITIAVVDESSNDAFDGLADQIVTALTADNDAASFEVAQTDGTTVVSESGTTDTFTVVLGRQPLTDVVIEVTPNDATETGVDKTRLTFTAANWDQAQTVTVTGQDDAVLDGSQLTPITLEVVDDDSDAAFRNLAPRSIQVVTTDDDAPGFTIRETDGETIVTEGGNSDAFTIVLNLQPSSNVVIDIESENADEASVNQFRVAFTPNNWNEPRTIFVSTRNDEVVDGDQTTEISFSVVDNLSDNNFDQLADQSIQVTSIDNDPAAIVITLTGDDTRVSEDGTSDQFEVSLAAEPLGPVVIELEASGATEASIDKSSLIFAPNTWDQPQVVTVTGVDDPTLDGLEDSLIVVAVDIENSHSAFHQAQSLGVVVLTEDNDEAGFTIVETNGSTVVDEIGSSDVVFVALNAQPLTSVVLEVEGDDDDEATANVSTLTFTNQNWNQAQAITITGQNDALFDGAQQTEFTIGVVPGQSNNSFANVLDQSFDVTTTDDEARGFTVFTDDGVTVVDESGATDTFSVVLSQQPMGTVVLSIEVNDETELSVDREQLTFTPNTFNTPQTVTITGQDDFLLDGNQTTPISVEVDDEESTANVDFPTQELSVVNEDNDLSIIVDLNGSENTSLSVTNDLLNVAINGNASPDHDPVAFEFVRSITVIGGQDANTIDFSGVGPLNSNPAITIGVSGGA
ncbi:MAG: hypothetical protein CMJ78_17385, partial [Planctomycetaceae bacterium]|nr:hypothetical protein [Planctomycetaceae bacterium]